MIELPETTSAPSLMPDMTALLDVIFILLVFMMLTANVAPHLLEVDLPQAAAPAQSIEPNVVTLGISEQGVFSIDNRDYQDWTDFQTALQQRIEVSQQQSEDVNLPLQILVAADKEVDLQYFVKLIASLSEKDLSVAEIVVSE